MAALIRHPDTAGKAVRKIEAGAAWRDDGTLALAYRVEGELAVLRIPPPAAPGRRDRLWKHTCFEAFVSVGDSAAYHEFNFAPTREWAAYAFRRYRESVPQKPAAIAPVIVVARGADVFELSVTVSLEPLFALQSRAGLRLGLSAVIEENHGSRSYWALRHPPGRPDFHHAEAFTLEIPPPGATPTGAPSA
jgi:hypothetical protein